jgi:hypothetical protein
LSNFSVAFETFFTKPIDARRRQKGAYKKPVRAARRNASPPANTQKSVCRRAALFKLTRAA